MPKQAQSQDKLGTMPVGKLLIVMSLPMMISMLVQALYNAIDAMFVARLSEDALTAVSLAWPFQNVMIAVGVGSGVGVSALVSRALGKGDREAAERTANVQNFLTVCYALVFAVLGLTLSRTLFTMQTEDPTIVSYGTTYLTICAVCCVGMLYGQNLEKLLTATGSSVLSMICQATGAVVNIILDPLLIFGVGPFPRLEVAGAAWATVIGQFVAAILALIFCLKYNQATRFRLRQMLPSWPIVKAIASIGVPSALTVCLGSAISYGMNAIILPFTTTAAAVFGVWMKLQYFAFMPVFGLNNGTIAIYSYNFGAGRMDRVRETLRLSIFISAGFTILAAIVYELIPRQMLGLFDASEHMLALGVPALRICAVSLPFGAMSVIFSSSYQSLGYSGLTLLVSVCRQMVFPLPIAWLLARSGVLERVWPAVPAGELMTFALAFFLARFVLKKAEEKLKEKKEM
ncbi:MAG: MATE family efflux transporter [Oscillospiraceae bacterium]|nr:MATE family efflux transporter [Oscillospiraceae bacterium]